MAKITGCGFQESTNSCGTVLDQYLNYGFEASSFSRAVAIVNEMLENRKNGCKIYLTYTSNLISSGVRETFRFLTENKLIDGIISTAGGIEEDFIKCLAPTYIGDFALDGATLRKQGVNRTGNLLVPNNNYCAFEDWFVPTLKKLLSEQKRTHSAHPCWTPSAIVHRMGKDIDHKESVYYWAALNNIPVFCPSLTDGSIGDMMFFFTINEPGLLCDINEDMLNLCDHVEQAEKVAIISLGGGMPKHHIMNACMTQGKGIDYFVNISTGTAWDGSDSSASIDQHIANGAIPIENAEKAIKVQSDATLAFPLLVAKTFAPYWHLNKAAQ